MKVSETLHKKYNHYYGQETLSEKRAIAATQTIQHLISLSPNCGANILDIGAGDGSLLKKLHQLGIGENLHALEVSASGIETIKGKKYLTCAQWNNLMGTISPPMTMNLTSVLQPMFLSMSNMREPSCKK